jgi:hypothetical protein
MNGPEVDLVIAEAKKYLQVREVPLGSNRGTAIDYWIAECGLDPKGGFPWCAAFVGAIGRQALGRARWPCPATASVAQLYAWADKLHIVESTAAVGDLFVVWHPELKRFGHVGLVVANLPAGRIGSIEGNTSGGGSREGWGVFARERTLATEDRCIRWTRALG